LIEKGASGVSAYVTHGVLSGEAVARVEKSILTELVLTDSICQAERAKASSRIRTVTVAPLLAEAIKRIAEESSVSTLFD
jgi:ribose-phosphate pyrophosphokinase